jgi:methionyl-tRNA formyltransferase
MGITDWNRPAGAVHDWIRALTAPYPGAFTFWAGRQVMLWASSGPDNGTGGAPGEVLGVGARGIRAGTAGGSVLVSAVSDPGASPEPAGAWAGRNGLRAGGRFDPVDPVTAAWALGLGPEPELAPVAG